MTARLILFADALFNRPLLSLAAGDKAALTARLLLALHPRVFTQLAALSAYGYRLALVVEQEEHCALLNGGFKQFCAHEGISLRTVLTAAEFALQCRHADFFASTDDETSAVLRIHGEQSRKWLNAEAIQAVASPVFADNAGNAEKAAAVADPFTALLPPPSVYVLKGSSQAAAELSTDGHTLTVSSWTELRRALTGRPRIVTMRRSTTETAIWLSLNLDGEGQAQISTGLHFLDHMLNNFAKHAEVDLNLHAQGDLQVDEHHSIEDTALLLGAALRRALGGKQGIGRYAFSVPMDESAAECLLDLSGRSYVCWDAHFKRERVGDFPTELAKHFFESLATAGAFNLQLKLRGENDHHQLEAGFKAFARCLRLAKKRSGEALPSTKGAL